MVFKTPKAPDRVPGSIHLHTVILVVVNYNSSHSCPGADWRKRGCHSAPTGPPTTTSNIQQSYTFTRGKVGEVSCPRTQRLWHNWPGGDGTANPPNISQPTLPLEPRSPRSGICLPAETTGAVRLTWKLCRQGDGGLGLTGWHQLIKLK